MSLARDIPTRSKQNSFGRRVAGSNSDDPNLSFAGADRSGSFDSTASSFDSQTPPIPAKQLRRYHTEDIKVLLLENINAAGQNILREQGYQVEALTHGLSEEQLMEKITDVHVLGIRSKTKITSKVIRNAKNLLAIGCYCIGTNQVDLEAAAYAGVPVFNSPFSNSRSVAELIIGEIITLARQLGDRNLEMHRGTWNKVSAGCWEVRGKTLGIVGYGHIGNQLSVLAESMGMKVLYYDVINIMSMGTARQVGSLEELLANSDFVTLHVPERPETKNMIGAEQFEQMRDGSYLINASRGSVVDIPSLIHASRTSKIAGAAVDVYPNEPSGNGDYFANDLNRWAEDLRSLKNVILTPHIGGSTEEAQIAIGLEVSEALSRYANEGTTQGSVNMPVVSLRSLTADEANHVRVIFIHKNIPGVLKRVNDILSDHNVDKQMSDSRGEVAFLMADISDVNVTEVKDVYERLESLPSCIRTRVLY